MAIRLRPSILTAGFGVLLAVIADLAWATAITTTGPWFTPSVSLAVYVTAIVLAAALSIVLVHEATSRVAALTASLARLDRRIALLRPARGSRGGGAAPSAGSDPEDDLNGLPSGGTRVLVRLEKEGHDALIPLPPGSGGAASTARTEVLRQLLRERLEIREARARVWSTAAGPVLASLVFLVIAGPMLPGSDGFAAAHYVLNTTLVLFLSYGLAPLVAWALLALAIMGSPAGRPSA